VLRHGRITSRALSSRTGGRRGRSLGRRRPACRGTAVGAL